MNKTSLTLIALIILLLGIGIFLGRNDAQTVDERGVSINDLNDTDPARKFNVQYAYEDGTHTFAGIINVPTSCDTVVTSSTEDKDGVMLIVDIETSDDLCTQVITPRPFLYSVIGDEKVNSTALVNGEIVELNLFPKESVEEIDITQFETKG